MGAQRVLCTVEIEVAVGNGRLVGNGGDEVRGEAVAHPEVALLIPVVSPRLLLGVGTRHGKNAGDAFERGDHALGVAGLCHDEQLTVAIVALHGGNSLVEQLGGEAHTSRRVTPLELVGTSVGVAASMTAPVEEHVIPGIGRQHHGQVVPLLPREDAGDVGRFERERGRAGILQRNPQIRDSVQGLACIDQAWLSRYFR